MKLTKKKILILTDWYLPAANAGGPVRSVAAIVSALKNDFEISVLTSDRDFGDSKSFQGIETDVWLHKDGYRLQYASPDNIEKTVTNEVKRDYDKIYLNSLFSKYFSISALKALSKKDKKNVILAPRGMLAIGALSIKPLKKKLFLTSAKVIGLYTGISWQASNEQEKSEILSIFPNARIATLRNLSGVVPVKNFTVPSLDLGLKIVTVARISPEKNFEFILNVLSKVSFNYTFHIYGPISNMNYHKKCTDLIRDNKLNVEFKGSLDHSQIPTVLKDYHLFTLPTLGENFGHSILEALAQSIPVLISDRTNWTFVNEKNAGKAISLNSTSKWIEWLNAFSRHLSEEHAEFRNAAFLVAEESISSKSLLEDYIKLFS